MNEALTTDLGWTLLDAAREMLREDLTDYGMRVARVQLAFAIEREEEKA